MPETTEWVVQSVSITTPPVCHSITLTSMYSHKQYDAHVHHEYGATADLCAKTTQ